MTNQIAGNAHGIPPIEAQDPTETFEIINVFFNEQVLSLMFRISSQLTKEEFLDLILDTLLPAVHAISGPVEQIRIQYPHTLFAPPRSSPPEQEVAPRIHRTYSW